MDANFTNTPHHKPESPLHPTTNNFVHILMRSAINFNGTSLLVGKEKTIKLWNGGRGRELEYQIKREEVKRGSQIISSLEPNYCFH